MATEAAIGASAGLFLFGYNRGNYMYDASFRYERFTTGREFAIQQMEQYRNDLKKLANLTVKKNKTFCVVASLTLALCIALYCAGRLGLHGPSPSSWIIGLWYTNNAAAFVYMINTIWLASHASFRAASASTHLLTRRARVPVPTLRQLDKARRFASEFEQQDVTDILRVPYLFNNGAPKTDNAARETADPSTMARAGSAPPRGAKDSKASSWIREEYETDKAGTVMGPAPHRADLAPEHFQFFGAVQKYWYHYDIYARISLSYGFLSLFHGLAYYGLGHINIELRAFWVPYGVAFVLMVFHGIVLRFDIVWGNKEKREWLPYFQWIGPLAPLPAAIAMSIDFRVQYEYYACVLTWFFIFAAYIMQFLYTCRMLVILIPDDVRGNERIGFSWWPEGWSVPSSFIHVLYIVAPPNKLQPGQHDTVREIKEGSAGSGGARDDDVSPVMSAEELKAQMDYVNRLFEYVFLDEVFLRMSKPGKERIQELHRKFTDCLTPNISKGNPEDNFTLARTLKHVVNGVEAVTSREGLGYLDTAGGADSSGAEGSGDKGPTKNDSGMAGNMSPRLGHFQKSPFKQTEHIQPWKSVALITLMLLAGWIFMICGTFVDLVLGEQALVTAPHWSRPPLTRQSMEPHELGTPIGGPTYAGSVPYGPVHMAWHEEKRHATEITLGRRLATPTTQGQRSGSATVPNAGLSAAFKGLLRLLPQKITSTGIVSADVNEVTKNISWPGFFEPQILACDPATVNGGNNVIALTPRGFGAAAHISHLNTKTTAAEAFKLAGISDLPPLLGASWGPMAVAESKTMNGHGLWLVSRTGHLVTCPGSHPSAGGMWHCSPPANIPSNLPISSGSKLVAAATSWLSDPSSTDGQLRLHAALIATTAPDVVALFVLETDAERPYWLPIGEMLVPRDSDGDRATKVSVAFVDGGDLIVTTDAGVMVRRSLHNGAMRGSITRSAVSIQRRESWRSTCAFPDGVAHLHLWERLPEIVTGDLPTMGPIDVAAGANSERHATTLPPVYQ